MATNTLRSELEELQRELAELLPRAEDVEREFLRKYFDEPQFEEQREQIVETLLADQDYRFELARDPVDGGHSSYWISWHGQRAPGRMPWILRYSSEWRGAN